VVEGLPSNCKAQSSNPNTAQKNLNIPLFIKENNFLLKKKLSQEARE
jgi:hypothetical protein